MLRKALVQYFRLFLNTEDVLFYVLPVAAMLVVASFLLPLVLTAFFGMIILLWSLHLEAEIHDTFLPQQAYNDALAYRGQFCFMWTLLGALFAGCIAFNVEAGNLRIALVMVGCLASGYFLSRCLDVARHAEAYLNGTAEVDILLLEMKPRFARWLQNGKTMDFPWNKRK
ncbi:MAG: hypothetical protein GC134_00570 [Proteobacteria bacterium]|nr:hypothetical protein [Pseudomonadota bacterium]